MTAVDPDRPWSARPTGAVEVDVPDHVLATRRLPRRRHRDDRDVRPDPADRLEHARRSSGRTGTLEVDFAAQRIQHAPAGGDVGGRRPSATRTAPAGPPRSTSSPRSATGRPVTLTDFATGRALHGRRGGRRTVRRQRPSRASWREYDADDEGPRLRAVDDDLPDRPRQVPAADAEPPSRRTAMNNARVVLDCRLPDHGAGDAAAVHTFVARRDCKTERVGADADLWLVPNGDFIPIFSDDAFMHIKTFARAGMGSQLESAGLAASSPTGCASPIAGTFERVHLDLVEREGERLADAHGDRRGGAGQRPCSSASIGSSPTATDAEIEYPVKTINANERDWVYQTDTGPILFPDLDCEPDELLTRLELAFTAANDPTWARVHRPGPDADRRRRRGLPLLQGRSGWTGSPTSSTGSAATGPGRVASGRAAGAACRRHQEGRREDHRHRVAGHRLRHRRGLGRGHHARGASTRPGTSTRSTRSRPTRASSATRCRTPTSATARRWSTSSTTSTRRRSSARTRSRARRSGPSCGG